jgi:DNA replication protein DnaT
MAGDWIKVQVVTPDKPEVHVIAEQLGIDDADAVLGKLVRIWAWADQQTFDGNAGSVTRSLIDRITGVTGFADAMTTCGWLEEVDGGFRFPNFDRHNGKTAKTRALTRNRVQKKRNAASVTSALPEKRREEKRRVRRTLRRSCASTRAILNLLSGC